VSKAFIEEYQARKVSYRALGSRLDELSIRTGIRVDTSLHGWVADSESWLQSKLMELRRQGCALRQGTWDSNARR